MGTSAERANSGVLAAGFDMTKPPTVITLFQGGSGVGSFDDKVTSKDWDSGDISKALSILSWDLDHHREGFRIVEVGLAVRVEKAGF